jgi:hypothetical protein
MDENAALVKRVIAARSVTIKVFNLFKLPDKVAQRTPLPCTPSKVFSYSPL